MVGGLIPSSWPVIGFGFLSIIAVLGLVWIRLDVGWRASAFAGAYPALAEAGWELVEAYTQERFAPAEYEDGSLRLAWMELQRSMIAAWLGRWGRRILRWAQRPEGERGENDLPWSLRIED